MNASQFIEPTAPDVRPIIELHRGNDGYVAFQRRSKEGHFEPVLSVKGSDLAELFPQFIAPHIEEESWFGINSMFLSPRQIATRSPIEPSLPRAQWGTSKLRYLTACYIDIDCYKLNITVGQCIGVCIDAQDRGAFPPASIFTRSGRGVWLFWLLRDEDDDDRPVRAWPEKISTYRRIERELLRKFGALGADAAATDPARITRVPGSLHRQSGKRVDYWMQLDKNKRPIAYRLDELAVALGVRPTKYTPGIDKAVNPKFIERAKKGHDALNRGRLSKLLSLIAERGNIAEGCRNHAALLLATFLHGCKIGEAELVQSVERFGRIQCKPALSHDEIADAIKKGRKGGYRFDDYTVGNWLKITPSEAELVGWPPEGSRPPEADTKLRNRGERTTARREIVRACVEGWSGGSMPTVRQLADHVENMMGMKVSTQTISTDLERLGIANPRARKADDGHPLLSLA